MANIELIAVEVGSVREVLVALLDATDGRTIWLSPRLQKTLTYLLGPDLAKQMYDEETGQPWDSQESYPGHSATKTSTPSTPQASAHPAPSGRTRSRSNPTGEANQTPSQQSSAGSGTGGAGAGGGQRTKSGGGCASGSKRHTSTTKGPRECGSASQGRAAGVGASSSKK